MKILDGHQFIAADADVMVVHHQNTVSFQYAWCLLFEETADAHSRRISLHYISGLFLSSSSIRIRNSKWLMMLTTHHVGGKKKRALSLHDAPLAGHASCSGHPHPTRPSCL